MDTCISDLKGKGCVLCGRFQDDCDGPVGWDYCDKCGAWYCYEDEGDECLCGKCLESMRQMIALDTILAAEQLLADMILSGENDDLWQEHTDRVQSIIQGQTQGGKNND